MGNYKGPNSYTAEDVIEINCHGGFISVKKILELILSKDVKYYLKKDYTSSVEMYKCSIFRLV